MSMTPNSLIVNEPEIVTPYRKEGDRLTPILTPTDASLVSYENTSPEAEFKGTNMKEALDTLFDRMPAMPDNGMKILATDISTSIDWTVPQGVYECLCVLISPGGSLGMYSGQGYHPGGYCLSFRMPTTPGTVLSMVIQDGIVNLNSVFHAGIYYKDNPNKLYSYAYTPKANTPGWSNTLPGAEVIFSSRAGKSYYLTSSSSSKNKNFQGGTFRIKNSDLAHFALYGGTSAYKTPTDATSSSPGVSVSGPSGARSNENSCDGFGAAKGSYMTPGLNASYGLIAVLWGPQIHV